MAIAVLVASSQPQCIRLVNRYVSGRKHNYHVIYLLDEIAPGRTLPSDSLSVLIGAALELRPATMGGEITIEPLLGAVAPVAQSEPQATAITISLEIFEIESGDPSRGFRFISEVYENSTVLLGAKLHSSLVELPCNVLLSGSEIELSAPVEIIARTIELRGASLIAKARSGEGNSDRAIILEADSALSTLNALSVEGAEFTVSLTDKSGHAFPLIKYVKERQRSPFTGDIEDVYMKLRKILTHFRSHGRGQLAKFRAKVDNPRVAGNAVGGRVLTRLLTDEVLYTSGNFYILNPGNLDKYLGIPWTALRDGLVCEKLEEYLEQI